MLKKENVLEERKRNQIANEITYVEKALGAKPFIFALPWTTTLYEEFPVTQVTAVAKRGIVPFVYGGLGPFDLPIPVPGFVQKRLHRVSMTLISKNLLKVRQSLGKNMEASSLRLWMR